MLVTCEQNRMVKTTRNSEFFDQKPAFFNNDSLTKSLRHFGRRFCR